MKLIKSDVGIITILTMLLFALVKYQDASAASVTDPGESNAPVKVIVSVH